MTTTVAKNRTLQDKLVEVALAIRNIEKGGYNSTQKYSFVSEADVVRKVWPELLERGILFYPEARRIVGVEPYTTSKGGAAFLTTIESVWVATDGTDRLTVASMGQGTDTGGDKGIYKALTGDKKYAVLQLLGIATGDDPENVRADEVADYDPAPKSEPLLNDEQRAELKSAVEESGLDVDQAGQFIRDWTGRTSLNDLTPDDLAKIVANLKQLAAFKVVTNG